MITFLYLVLLLAFLFLEKMISINANHRGLILAFIVFVAGFIICSQLKYIGVILFGMNLARTCIQELKYMDLTSE